MKPAIVRRVLLLTSAGCSFAQASVPNYTAMWWNAAESGWGLNIAHQGDVLFPVWFTYDANGRLQWYAVSGATIQADGRYSGPVFRFKGKPFDQISVAPAFDESTAVGRANLHFASSSSLYFNYTIDGVTQTK